MDSNIDIIELLRECAAQDHGMAMLRDSLGIGLEHGWQQRCLARVADIVEAELDEERESSAFWEAEHDVELRKHIDAERRIADMERTHMDKSAGQRYNSDVQVVAEQKNEYTIELRHRHGATTSISVAFRLE